MAIKKAQDLITEGEKEVTADGKDKIIEDSRAMRLRDIPSMLYPRNPSNILIYVGSGTLILKKISTFFFLAK
jgi:hypothetical protein